VTARVRKKWFKKLVREDLIQVSSLFDSIQNNDTIKSHRTFKDKINQVV